MCKSDTCWESEEEGRAWKGRTPLGLLDSVTEMDQCIFWLRNKKPFVIVTKKMIVNSVGIKYTIDPGSPFPRFLLTAKGLCFHWAAKSGIVALAQTPFSGVGALNGSFNN